MRGLYLSVAVAFAVAGCGGADDAGPDCQGAMTHFYESGCRYRNPGTDPPTLLVLDDAITRCRELKSFVAMGPCRDELDEWLRCNSETPDLATTSAECDCTEPVTRLNMCVSP